MLLCVYTRYNLFAHSSCTSLYILLFIKATVYCITHFILLHILLFIYLKKMYLYVYILSCVMLRILHCPLSRPDQIYISLRIIFCIIEFVVNKEPNKAPSLNPPLMQYCHVIVGKRNSNQGNVLFITTANLVIPIIYKVDFKITGAGHIIRISSKSWFISLIPFKKWNLYNVYIHSTQNDIFQVSISFNFDDYNWQLMKTPNSVSQKIRILLKTNTKKGFLEILANWKVWTWKVWACTALNT